VLKNLYLFQPQYNFRFRDADQYWFPYSTGSIWAYACQFPDILENWQLKKLGFRRDDINQVVEEMSDPHLVGFSVYIWNRNYCLALAAAIKKCFPDCLIVVGGPMVNESWNNHEFIDSVVLKEGEQCFVEILRTVAAGADLDSVYQHPRMNTLEDVPSPYTSGVFDHLVEENPDYYWSATLETNRGCPYACTFCDWGGLTQSKMKKFDLQRIQAELDWIAKQRCGSLMVADSNFGLFFERDRHIAAMIRQAADQAGIEYISTNYTKFSHERIIEITKLLGTVNKGITLSAQSMNPATLDVIKRKNLKPHEAQHLFDYCTENQVPFYTEMMLGLPLETRDSWFDGLCELLEMGQHNNIIVIPTVVLENTELGDHQAREYSIKTVEIQEGFSHTVGHNSNTIVESWPWTRSTSTMSESDMIDGYMFGWMLINLHTMVGHSMLLSKYCRYCLGIPYREFYRHMWDQLQQPGTSVVHQHYRKTRSVVEELYSQGKSSHSEIGAHNAMTYSSLDFHKHFDQTHEFVQLVARNFGEIDPGVIDIQKRWTRNQFFDTPFTAQTQVNIDTWKEQECQYRITSKDTEFDPTYANFWSLQWREKRLHNIREMI